MKAFILTLSLGGAYGKCFGGCELLGVQALLPVAELSTGLACGKMVGVVPSPKPFDVADPAHRKLSANLRENWVRGSPETNLVTSEKCFFREAA